MRTAGEATTIGWEANETMVNIGRRASICAVGLLFLFASTAARGQSVASSKRVAEANRSVLAILLGNDMTEAVAAARGLGERKSAAVGPILQGLYSRTTGAQSYRYELLLRIALESVFLLPSPSPARIKMNDAALEGLLGALQSIADAQTKRDLLQISEYLPEQDVEKPLLDEGAFLIGHLRMSKGRFGPERLSEALGFLGACMAHDNQVVRQQVIMMVRLSRNASFVRQARQYLSDSRSE